MATRETSMKVTHNIKDKPKRGRRMTLGFRQFEQRGQARIYLDMDGVLCDFIKGVKDTTGEDFTSLT